MLIAGNWKMYKGPDETREFCARLRARLHGFEGADVIVCPPYPSLHDAVGMLAVTEIGVFAQNAHWAKEGPYTGEVSPWMLKEHGRWRHARRALGAPPAVRRDRRVGRAADRGLARRGAARDRLCRRDARTSTRRGRRRT